MSRDVAADNMLKALLPLVVFGVATGVVLTTMAVMAAIRKTPHKSTEDCPEIPSECTPCVAYAGIAQIEALMDPGEVHSTPQYQFPAPVGSVRREAGMTFESLGPNFHAHSAQQLTLSENGWSATIGTLGIGVAQMTPIDFPTWEEHGELQNSHLPTSALMDKHTTFALCQWDATLGAGRAVMFDTSHDLATTTRFDPREAIPVYCQDGVDPDFRRGTHSHPTQCLSLMTYLASNEPGCALLGWAGGDRVGMMVFSTAFCSNDRSPRVVPRRRLPYAFHTESDLAGLSTAETVLAGNHIAFWAFSDTGVLQFVQSTASGEPTPEGFCAMNLSLPPDLLAGGPGNIRLQSPRSPVRVDDSTSLAAVVFLLGGPDGTLYQSQIQNYDPIQPTSCPHSVHILATGVVQILSIPEPFCSSTQTMPHAWVLTVIEDGTVAAIARVGADIIELVLEGVDYSDRDLLSVISDGMPEDVTSPSINFSIMTATRPKLGNDRPVRLERIIFALGHTTSTELGGTDGMTGDATALLAQRYCFGSGVYHGRCAIISTFYGDEAPATVAGIELGPSNPVILASIQDIL